MSEQILLSIRNLWKVDSAPISFRDPASASLFRNRQPVRAQERELVPVAARQNLNGFLAGGNEPSKAICR